MYMIVRLRSIIAWYDMICVISIAIIVYVIVA